MIVKNTFGCSTVLGSFIRKKAIFREFGGSSLDRKKRSRNEFYTPAISNEQKEKELRSMSSRTKSKIRKKLFAFAQLYKRLTFVTLTFVNKVDDRKAIEILRKFLDNIKKNKKDFQYLWVAERQTQNKVFEDNIHFHLLTNIYWDIEKTW